MKALSLKVFKGLNPQNIKKYKLEILVAVVCILGGLLITGKPGTEMKIREAAKKVAQEVSKGQKNATAGKDEAKAPEVVPVPSRPEYTKIDAKNIFSISGSYETSKELKQIPENAYSLVAILHGTEKRIIVREFTGDLVSVKEGGTLIDGAVVQKIGENVVTVAKGDQTKELKILDYKALATRKPSVDVAAARSGGPAGTTGSGEEGAGRSRPARVNLSSTASQPGGQAGSQPGGQRAPGGGSAPAQRGKR